MTHLGRRAEICDVGKNVERGTNAQTKGPSNHESPYRISDVVEHVVGARPASVCKQDFVSRRRVLYIVIGTRAITNGEHSHPHRCGSCQQTHCESWLADR